MSKRETCTHPSEGLRPAMLADDARYCPACSSLVFDDGHVEPVEITGIRTTKR